MVNKVEFLNSHLEENIGIYNETNHIFSFLFKLGQNKYGPNQKRADSIIELYSEARLLKNFKPSFIPYENGLKRAEESFFTSWKIPNTDLDIVVYTLDNNDIVWEPIVEMEKRIEILSKHNYFNDFNIAYVDGLVHHMGSFSTQGLMAANNSVGYMMITTWK